MKYHKHLAIIALAACVIATSHAAEDFVVATGDLKAGSTYATMFNQLNEACLTETRMVDSAKIGLPTTGSVQSAELLTTNQVSAAFLQGDILEFYRVTNPMKVSNIRTIVGLHPEELHWVARADTKSEGGVLGLGASKVNFNTVSDLKGRIVGAAGGSAITARVFSQFAGLNLIVKEYANNTDLMKDLTAKVIDSVLIVAGSPNPLVAGLGADFRLLSVTPDMQKTVAKIYSPIKLGYQKMGNPVDAVATQAIFVTRMYRDPEMIAQVSSIRSCFLNKLGKIQDKRGTHAKWQAVNSTNHGAWDYYDLPATVAAAPVAAPAPVVPAKKR